jgi:hypothetical protein
VKNITGAALSHGSRLGNALETRSIFPSRARKQAFGARGLILPDKSPFAIPAAVTGEVESGQQESDNPMIAMGQSCID